MTNDVKINQTDYIKLAIDNKVVQTPPVVEEPTVVIKDIPYSASQWFLMGENKDSCKLTYNGVEYVKAEEKTEDKEQIGYQRKLYKFTLEDFTGGIGCVFFSNKENQAKIEKLDTDSVIVVRGALEADEYSGGNTLKVKDIAYCSICKNL